MTDYKEENDELRREIKRLTQENKALRMTALDEFVKALLCGGGLPNEVWIFDRAEAILAEKVRRYESR